MRAIAPRAVCCVCHLAFSISPCPTGPTQGWFFVLFSKLLWAWRCMYQCEQNLCQQSILRLERKPQHISWQMHQPGREWHQHQTLNLAHVLILIWLCRLCRSLLLDRCYCVLPWYSCKCTLLLCHCYCKQCYCNHQCDRQCYCMVQCYQSYCIVTVHSVTIYTVLPVHLAAGVLLVQIQGMHWNLAAWILIRKIAATLHPKPTNPAAMWLQEQERLNAELNAKLAQQQAEEEERRQQQVSRLNHSVSISCRSSILFWTRSMHLLATSPGTDVVSSILDVSHHTRWNLVH